MYVCMYVYYICMYIYIYIERERERDTCLSIYLRLFTPSSKGCGAWGATRAPTPFSKKTLNVEVD